MNKELKCIKCGLNREKGRKMCRSCFLIEHNVRNKKRYYENGKKRTTYPITCIACSCVFQAWRKTSTLCSACYKLKGKLAAETCNLGQYVWCSTTNKKYLHKHRAIAETLMERTLATNEVVHHLDNDPKNNQVTNLIVLDRRSHGRLHLYLDTQRVILEKSGNDNTVNCWDNLIIPITTAWLETTSVKVIKLWELGQSAAKPLKEKSNEEGSETRHSASETSNAVDEGIVQTTTHNAA